MPLLFFPDSCEPDGRAYDAVVAEVEDQGVWIALGDAIADEGHDAVPLPATSFEIGQFFEGMQRQIFDALGVQEQEGPEDEVPPAPSSPPRGGKRRDG